VPDLEADVARSRSKAQWSYYSIHFMTNGRDPPVTNIYANDTRDISPIVLTKSQLHRRKTFTKNPNARIGFNPCSEGSRCGEIPLIVVYRY